jgi:hypothetical protein
VLCQKTLRLMLIQIQFDANQNHIITLVLFSSSVIILLLSNRPSPCRWVLYSLVRTLLLFPFRP